MIVHPFLRIQAFLPYKAIPSANTIILVRELSNQSAQVSWRVPDDIECNGKLMGFIMEVNSTYDTSQLITIIVEAGDHSLTGFLNSCETLKSVLFSPRLIQ
ncbi:hypothetical protein TSMEX_010142 [Taenia solium]|eukprot:TsM_000554500 transcript=TsM_000554500 gene=TsM_000554500